MFCKKCHKLTTNLMKKQYISASFVYYDENDLSSSAVLLFWSYCTNLATRIHFGHFRRRNRLIFHFDYFNPMTHHMHHIKLEVLRFQAEPDYGSSETWFSPMNPFFAPLVRFSLLCTRFSNEPVDGSLDSYTPGPIRGVRIHIYISLIEILLYLASLWPIAHT